MIKREYFYSGRLVREGAWEFCGMHRRTSFFQDAAKVMGEIEEHISKKADIEKEKILFDKFHRI